MQVQRSEGGADERTRARPPSPPAQPNARSRHPIFKGERLVVFDWQLEDLARLLGPHTDDFDLHAWFYQLDGELARSGIVLPPRDKLWLQEQTVNEAQRRGLPIAVNTSSGGKRPSLVERMMAAAVNIGNESRRH